LESILLKKQIKIKRRCIMKKTKIAVAVVLVLLLLCGCSVGANQPAKSATEQSNTPTQSSAAAQSSVAAQDATKGQDEGSFGGDWEDPLAKDKLLGPVKNASDYEGKLACHFPIPTMFGENCFAGVAAYTKDTGVPVKTIMGVEFTQTAQNAQIETLLSQGYKYFGIFGADGAGTNGLMQELESQGCISDNLGWDSVHPTVAKHLVATDLGKAAAIATEKLCELMNYKGNIIVCYGFTAELSYKQRKEAVASVVAKYPDVKIIAELSDMTTPESTLAKFNDGLVAHEGKIDGIVAVGAYGSSISSVLEEQYQKGAKRMKCVLIDIDDVMIKHIKAGVFDGTIVQNEFGIGYIGSEVLRLQADGWKPKEGMYHIDTGVVYVDKTNIDNYSGQLTGVTKQILQDLTTKYMQHD
jgi:ribose transport system substrate-binding protein